MSIDAWITCGTVGLVMLLLLSNRVSVDVAMAAGLVLLLIFRVVDVETALSGFSHPAVLVIASLFVVAAGLRRTGAIQSVAERLLGRPETITSAQLRLMAPVAMMSAFVNNTPIVAMYLPIVGEWARRIRLSPSKLFMPLSYGAILGGQITLIGTSSNIVVMGLYLRYLQENHPSAQPSAIISSIKQFWGPAFLGIPTTIVGIGFVIAFSRWLLPSRKPALRSVLDTRKYTVQMDIQGDSPIVGKSIEDAGLRHLPGLFVTEVERAAELVPAPSRNFVLRAGDRLSFAGILESVVDLRQIRGLAPATDQVAKIINPERGERILVEAVVSHNSPLVGQSVRRSRFRTRYNAAIVAVHRNGEQIEAKVGDIELRPGDTLLLETHKRFVDAYRNSGDFYLVSTVGASSPIRHDRAWVSLAILAVLVCLLTFTSVPPVVVALSCALGMILTGCVTPTIARNNTDWQVLIVIACALGMGAALQATGVAQHIAGHILALCRSIDLGPRGMLFVTFLLSAGFAQLITNNGAAVLMFPIAMETAQVLGVSLEPFMFTLMIGVGSSFITPVSYQTNLMVHGPGGYRFSDFARLGIPLTILVAAVAAALCPLAFPF